MNRVKSKNTMSSLKIVKAYLLYLEKFKEISKSVQLIAIAKLRKMRARIDARECALSFAVELFDECGNLEQECAAFTVVVITSDRSCCGKLNGEVLEAARDVIDSYIEDNKAVRIISVGRKGYASFATAYKSTLRKRITSVRKPSFFLSYVITLCVLDTQFDKCALLFSKYYSYYEQAAGVYEFSSFSRLYNYIYANRKNNLLFDLLLSADVSIKNLYLYHLCIVVLDAFEENKYSELGCRAFSMELANRNAAKLIKENKLVFNKLRQASITTSLLEVVSGAIYGSN
jgi:F-type H+-transporting ATPase subunit gamma